MMMMTSVADLIARSPARVAGIAPRPVATGPSAHALMATAPSSRVAIVRSAMATGRPSRVATVRSVMATGRLPRAATVHSRPVRMGIASRSVRVRMVTVASSRVAIVRSAMATVRSLLVATVRSVMAIARLHRVATVRFRRARMGIANRSVRVKMATASPSVRAKADLAMTARNGMASAASSRVAISNPVASSSRARSRPNVLLGMTIPTASPRSSPAPACARAAMPRRGSWTAASRSTAR